MFYRFRTVFRGRDGIVTWCKFCVLLFLHLILCCVRACARPACDTVSSYRGLFLYLSTLIRINPPRFFQNTNTGLLRIILTIHFGCLNKLVINDCGEIEASRNCTMCRYTVSAAFAAYIVPYGCTVLQHLLILVSQLSHM